jgi:16S rRNA (uracil1498-N3)-methyltransferase
MKDGAELGQEQSAKVLKVLRMKIGHELVIFNTQNEEWLCSISSINKMSVIIKKKQLLRKLPQIAKKALAFCPIKSHKVKFIVEKGTELGITDFYPIRSVFTNNHINHERERQIAISAAEQAERIDVPRFHNVRSLEDFISNLPSDFAWFSTLERKPHLQLIFDIDIPSSSGFIIGPEGGWTEKEALLLEQFTTALTLSGNVLRTETAAILCAAVICARAK